MDTIKYITQNDLDMKWGLTISSVGFQRIAPGETYPPQKHNREYMFDPANGRVLFEYQLLYIAEGGGIFVSESSRRYKVSAGNMFLLFPGERHSYRPDADTGWSEYWIGFIGPNIDDRVKKGFFHKETPLYDIGYNETVIELYREAIRTAKLQEPFFQQLLAGIVNHLLGLMVMADRKKSLKPDEKVFNMIDKARSYMQESLEKGITMPDVAEHLGINYTFFRNEFKKFTGCSPSQYFINLKIHRAKEILRSTNTPVKEIAYDLHFENPDYFMTLFKKKTGFTPSEFRNR
ncbi:MAG: AraC family transcriptional regulator [Candidatus Cryptobacteroides sp.]